MKPKDIQARIEERLQKEMRHYRPIEQNYPELKKPLDDMFREFRFMQEPYLESIPYYALDKEGGLQGLTEGGDPVLCKETAEAFAAYFGCASPKDVSLYQHQVEAVKAVHNGDNLLVCTGTGSGKTESFLIPLIDGIVRERKKCAERGGEYLKGIRALILYPMNALVNDQLRRIRSIIRLAQEKDIPYVQDITFGRYTGDVLTEYQEQQERGEDNNADIRNQLHGIPCVPETEPLKHPSFLPDSAPSTEYTRRAHWRTLGPADILITNYTMLERMMLNPDYEGFFNTGTWKYIVLDEAHTYDGALGTDIAWLLRRLSLRVQQPAGSQALTYMATSATLVEEGANREERIRKEFAERLFPADGARPFSVQLGQTYDSTALWQRKPDGADPALSYVEVAQARPTPAEWADMLPLMKRFPGGKEEDDAPRTLMQLTGWLAEARAWLESLHYIHEETRATLPLGDAVELASLCGRFKENAAEPFSLGMEDSPFLSFIGDVRDECWVKAIQGAYGNVGQAKTLEIKDKLNDAITDGNIPAAHYTTLAYLLSVLATAPTRDEHEGDTPLTPERWSVTWSADSMTRLEEVRQELSEREEDLDTFGKLLLAAWKRTLGDTKPDSSGALISRFILRRPHAQQLACILANPDTVQDRARTAVVKRLFGDAPDAEEQLDALTDLLTLTKHPELRGKSLLDLRYHQSVCSIGSVAVHFEKDPDGVVRPVFHANDDRVQDGQGHPLYTLDVCYECATPFISFYPREIARLDVDGGQFPLRISRYKVAKAQTHMVMTWVKPRQTDFEDGEGLNEAPLYFDYRHGTLRLDETEDTIRIYAYKGFEPCGSIDCPVCGRKTYSGSPPIGDYKTGSDVAKYVIISSLAGMADKDNLHHLRSVADGRKLLVFSDSRQGAATQASTFEIFNTDAIILNGLQELLHPEGETMDDEAYERLYEYYQSSGEENWDYGKFRKTAEMICKEYPGLEALLKANPNPALLAAFGDGPKDAGYFTGSLKEFVPGIRQYLERVGALPLLEREYKLQGDHTSRCYPPNAATVLAMLATLRKSGRNSAVRSGAVAVRSFRYAYIKKHNTQEYQDFCAHFGGNEAAADSFFLTFYNRLFLKGRICPDEFCKGLHFESEICYSPGGGNLAGRALAMNGYDATPKRYISENRQQLENEDTLSVTVCDAYGRTSSRFYLSRLYESTMAAFHIHVEDTAREDHMRRSAGLLYRLLTAAPDNGIPRMTIRLQGGLLELNLEDIRFYRGGKPRPEDDTPYLRIEEHTAQISSANGQLYQRQFMDGLINILSCSTTFEMGVDLGNLNCVLMANMPPTTANYKQRAGRAGRRPGSTSYVLTYLGDTAHDSYYKDHPYDLFFGKIRQPQIYLENPTFRAKHLRAEALHALLCNLPDITRKNNKAFFKPSTQALSKLADFVGGQGHEDLQENCRRLAASATGAPWVEYDVLLDLLYQTYSKDTLKAKLGEAVWGRIQNSPFAKPETFRQFSGPNDPNHPEEDVLWHAPAQIRYEMQTLGGDDTLAKEDIYSSLPTWGVIPRYGFPCNVIELKTKDKELKLQRDAKQGIFEYMVGRKVVANKYVYASKEPRFLIRGNGTEEQHRQTIHHCPICNRYTLDRPADGLCCGLQMEERNFCVPDQFVAFPGQRVRSVVYNTPTPRVTIYEAQQAEAQEDFLPVPSTNIQSLSSDLGELFYINETECQVETGQGEDKTETKYDGALHIVRTEIALWQMGAPLPPGHALAHNPLRLKNAYNSALQAILKATALVLGIKEGDINGLVHEQPDATRLVLYDESANGAGTIMKLFMNRKQSEALNTQAARLSVEILRKALELCKDAHGCYCEDPVEAAKTPRPYTEYLELRENGNTSCRPYTACYKCLKSYRNQKFHEALDATDAALLLTHLLGDAANAAEEAVAQAEPAAHTPEEAPATTPAPVPTPAPAAGVFNVEGFIRDYKNGRIRSGERFLVNADGKAVEAQISVVVVKNGLYTFITREGTLHIPATYIIKQL